MSSNLLPPRPRKKRPGAMAAPTPPEPIEQPPEPSMMKPKKPRKTNMGNAMRQKNRRISAPLV